MHKRILMVTKITAFLAMLNLFKQERKILEYAVLAICLLNLDQKLFITF